MCNVPERRARVAGCLVLGLALSAALAVAEEPEPFELRYRSHLHAWAGGEPGAVASYSDVQHRTMEHAVGKPLVLAEVVRESQGLLEKLPMEGLACVLRVEHHTDDLIVLADPELRLALAAFHLELHVDQVARAFRPWIESLSRSRYEELLDQYGRGIEGDVPRIRALYDAWLAVGATQIRLGYRVPIQRARFAFERARELDPESLPARYWIAFADEKLGFYDDATYELQALAKEFPGSAEIRLRLARQLVQRGRKPAAREELAGILEGAASPRVRVVAYQELASLLAARPDGWSRAVELLERAIEESPANQRLRIQLSFLRAERALAEDRRDLPAPSEVAVLLAESEAGVLALLGSEWPTATERSPRLRYELPDATIVRPSLESFAERIVRQKARLVGVLDDLPRIDLAATYCDSIGWRHP